MMEPERRKFTQSGILVPSLLILIGLLFVTMAFELDYITNLIKDKPDKSVKSTDGVSLRDLSDLRLDFSLPTVGGEMINTVDLRGKYVLVNFWASWCPPCVQEMPTLESYYREHREQSFELVAVNYAENIETVTDFVEFNDFSFLIVMDFNGTVFNRQYKSESLPSSFLIGPDGTLAKAWPPGALSQETLERDITPLLEGQ